MVSKKNPGTWGTHTSGKNEVGGAKPSATCPFKT